MSLKIANQLFREGKIQEALLEYKQIHLNSSIYQQAQFNIRLIESRSGIINYVSGITNNSNKPLVSIVMPIFNVAPYLDESIMSVLNQSYQNIELIIINDYSTDNSADIIKMYTDRDSRIKVIHLQTNTMGGTGIPSNIGVEFAQGHYLAYIDGDDILDKYAVQKMVESALIHQVDIVIADFQSFHNETKSFEHSYDKKNWADIPLNKPFVPESNPKIFKLSPVPWRKLYKISFLNENNIIFPEGDYFYEDNVLHWLVLTQAKRVVLLDYVVTYHRIGREGQTTSAISLKLLSHLNHLNTIKNHFLHMQNLPVVYWKELVDFSYRVGWIVDKQAITYQAIAKKRYAQTVLEVAKNSDLLESDILKIRPNFYKRCKEYNQTYDDLDLSIVVSISNSTNLLPDIIESLLKINLKKDIFLVSDGFNDNSWQICQHYTNKYKNIYCIAQDGKSLGAIKNLVIPLLTGYYTYFMSTDILIDSKAVGSLVKFATSHKYDLVFFNNQEKSNTRYIKDSNDDWIRMLDGGTNKDKKVLASQLDTCFWNRIIKTSKLHNENIFFATTIIYDNIPYHWHTIISAENIGFFNTDIYSYQQSNKYKQHGIIDNYDAVVSEVHRYTHSILRRYNDYDALFDCWYQFVANVLTSTKGTEGSNKIQEVYYEKFLQN